MNVWLIHVLFARHNKACFWTWDRGQHDMHFVITVRHKRKRQRDRVLRAECEWHFESSVHGQTTESDRDSGV